MYVDSFSRILLISIVTLMLTACGGGGGGGGGSILDGDGSSGGSGGSGGSGSSSGTIELSVTGMVDASGDEDNVLAGNETATLRARANENGVGGDLVVVFSTTGGTLVQTSAQTNDGIAEVQIIGDGTAGGATVVATATLSDGTQISDSITIQTSADAPSLLLVDTGGTDLDSVDLLSGESQQIVALVTDWNGTPLQGIGVSFTANAVDVDIASGVSSSTGEVLLTLTGRDTQNSGTLSSSATFNSFNLSDAISANSLGLDTANNSVSMDAINVGADGVLDGNEKVSVVARVIQDGAARDGITVTFTASSGTLSPASATTAGGGIATVELIGAGVAGVTDITASATFGGGANVTDTQTIQTSGVRPTLTLEVRNQSGVNVTEFGSNEELTFEATIVDYDGTALDADDAGVAVTFDLGGMGSSGSTSDLTEFEACPVVGVKQPADCAFIEVISGANAGVGTVAAEATLNGILIEDSVTVNNTGSSGGSPDQDSFTLTRIVGGTSFAQDDTVAIEGDQYNNEAATIRVDMADFFNNPVPDGTVVEFTTELGDIDPSCEISSGFCEVTFVSGEPRAPTNTEVSFKNLDVDNCPSAYIEDEIVTIDAGGNGSTQYRVEGVGRVRMNGTTNVRTEGVDYTVTSTGIDCITCTAGQVVQITYHRLWLDEENDNAITHTISAPGVATEPFLETSSTPCFARYRPNLEEISGSIDPTGTTAVGGVGTSFRSELAVGDYLKVGKEVRQVVSVATDTSLQVASAFSDTGNDTSPERIAAPAYLGGMGQPYGGRSSILIYAVGEESFDDTNGNDEYDFGETFTDLSEAFIDKNEDGVLGDTDGDSAVAGTLGPYIDGGSGATAPGEAREKSSPFCYGPVTIKGVAGDGNDSTESSRYCYQDGGEEELFVDANGNGVMDVGNGIYNGSRCLRPLQDADGDGLEDDTVCTTDLVNVSKSTEILLAGSFARTAFRAFGSNGEGGTDGFGEIVSGIENKAGIAFDETIPTPTSWVSVIPAPGTVTLSDNLPGLPFGGAQIDTSALDGNFVLTDDEEEVSLFEVTNPFSTTFATYTLDFDITDWGQGVLDVYVGTTRILTACTGVGGVTTTCNVTGFSMTSTDDLRFVVGEDGANEFRFIGTVSNILLEGTTTGITNDFSSTENLASNDRLNVVLTDFNVGDDLDGTTVFPGVSERQAPSGTVPTLTTSVRSGIFWFTDKYNGQLPEGTKVKIESESATGCQLTSVGGVAVTGDSREITVGQDADFGVSYSVTAGGGGAGAIIATVTTPIGNVTTDSIACNLLL